MTILIALLVPVALLLMVFALDLLEAVLFPPPPPTPEEPPADEEPVLETSGDH
ncbi:hypothetical protein [Streptomyces sp. NPDC127038]|uniref:hypothetical protein n=1 Tax=Streptomyces sp. NPDC127038 TaxID=3347114 RepID=UPI003664CE95